LSGRWSRRSIEAAMRSAPEDGGQGLPAVLEAMLYEMLSAANHGWTMAPGLLHGAYECIKHHAAAALKEGYLEKVATGEWLATMCLTEAQAGSDLGLARTRALPQADGSYRLDGTKIFISGGEHDLTDNIVHLVLARLPGAPPGPKGLSLFLAPKWRSDGARNAVHCERIEEKMGLHGSPTCVLRFDQASASIIGEPGRGLNAMFVMMNAARLHVALQGIGLLDAAWQKADADSRQRRQMRAPGRAKSAAEADLIGEHPAMRRILDTQRAWIDAGRVLAYRTALELDLAKHHPDAARRDAAQRWCSLVTPVIKAAFTQQAFYGGSECLQVCGGHGYVRESGIEQNVRGARVAMSYEGSNEIQAIDLLVRKVLPDGGQALVLWIDALRADLDAARPNEARVLDRLVSLVALTDQLLRAVEHDNTLAHWVADDYLRAVALILLDWAWAQIGRAAAPDMPRWCVPAQAHERWVMPELSMRFAIIANAAAQARRAENTS
jgi:alkylation response protein AidB-like acyl-CoA dehydrogenase